MVDKLQRYIGLLILALLLLGQLPHLIQAFNNSTVLPQSVLFIPVELAIVLLATVFCFYSSKITKVLLSVFIVVVMVDGFTSLYSFFHFFNPFAEAQYVKVVPAEPDTIRFSNREWLTMVVAFFLAIYYIAFGNSQIVR